MHKLTVITLFAMMAVAYNLPAHHADSRIVINGMTPKSSINNEQIISSMVKKIVDYVSNELDALVDFIVKRTIEGVDPVVLQNSPEMRGLISNMTAKFIKWLLDLFTFFYELLVDLVEDGIAISTQLLDSLSEAIEILASGEMPPIDVIKGLIVECLGILGRKRRDIGHPIADNYIKEIYSSIFARAQARLESNPMYAQMSSIQVNNAVRTIKWAIHQLLAVKQQ